MNKEYLTIDKIAAYKTAFKLSNYIWKVVATWENFDKWTVGQQLLGQQILFLQISQKDLVGIIRKIKSNFTNTVSVLWKKLKIGLENVLFVKS